MGGALTPYAPHNSLGAGRGPRDTSGQHLLLRPSEVKDRGPGQTPALMLSWPLPVSRYWYLLTSSFTPQRLSEASVWMYCTWGILVKPRYICGREEG